MSDLSDRLSRAKDELGYSTRQISAEADKAGYRVSNATAAVYTNGKHGKPDARTVEALSVVLRVPLAELRELAGLPQQHGKFELAPEADTLTAPQRAAVNEVIRQLAEANAKAGEGNADSSPSMNQAGGKPATGEDDGLGAFGHRDRGDLDHDNINDGNGDNVRQMWPDLDTMAADTTGETIKQKLDKEAADRGEEDQTPPDDD